MANLGGSPVVERGELSVWRRRGAVPVGHVLVLYGRKGELELLPGSTPAWTHRMDYPSFALVDLSPRIFSFEREYATDDGLFRYKIAAEGRVKVTNGARYIADHGPDGEVGLPFYELWQKRISGLVSRHGRAGVDDVRDRLDDLREAVERRRVENGGLRLISCEFTTSEDPAVVIREILLREGLGAGAWLKMHFPNKAHEIDQLVSDVYQLRGHERDDIEDAVQVQLRIADAIKTRNIFDPDELKKVVSLNDIQKHTQLAKTLPAGLFGALESKPADPRISDASAKTGKTAGKKGSA
jgi:hypothetical protein